MQTALFLTDCSVDSALSLRGWLVQHTHEPLRLTVVHPYEIEGGDTLHKSVCTPAKSEAVARLAHWRAMLGEVDTIHLNTEALFARPNVALMIHLLIRGYDYWVVDNWAMAAVPSVAALLEQSGTKVRSLRENADREACYRLPGYGYRKLVQSQSGR